MANPLLKWPRGKVTKYSHNSNSAIDSTDAFVFVKNNHLYYNTTKAVGVMDLKPKAFFITIVHRIVECGAS